MARRIANEAQAGGAKCEQERRRAFASTAATAAAASAAASAAAATAVAVTAIEAASSRRDSGERLQTVSSAQSEATGGRHAIGEKMTAKNAAGRRAPAFNDVAHNLAARCRVVAAATIIVDAPTLVEPKDWRLTRKTILSATKRAQL